MVYIELEALDVIKRTYLIYSIEAVSDRGSEYDRANKVTRCSPKVVVEAIHRIG
jgi:hypothetical protein